MRKMKKKVILRVFLLNESVVKVYFNDMMFIHWSIVFEIVIHFDPFVLNHFNRWEFCSQ